MSQVVWRGRDLYDHSLCVYRCPFCNCILHAKKPRDVQRDAVSPYHSFARARFLFFEVFRLRGRHR